MQAVNEATLQTLEQFKRKSAEVPFEEHPYTASRKAALAAGVTAWDEESRESALSALTLWVKTVVIGSVVVVLNEIVALMKIAAETGEAEHRKAAEDMASSMTFVENVMHQYVEAVNCRHIAEYLFAHGEQIEAEMAAAEAAKEKVKAFNAEKAPLQGKIHRIEPSVN